MLSTGDGGHSGALWRTRRSAAVRGHEHSGSIEGKPRGGTGTGGPPTSRPAWRRCRNGAMLNAIENRSQLRGGLQRNPSPATARL
ncbi:hypothetical protein TI01_1272 [Lysobacter sp. A03]|nr:hypothetical protein TI01_1272 [Lysobacter sp. A03]